MSQEPAAAEASEPEDVSVMPDLLARIDAELCAAIESFQRARRVGIKDLFQRRDSAIAEEVHVGHALRALVNAERHVARALRIVEGLPSGDPTRGQLWPPVRILDTTVRSALTELGQRTDPTRVVSHLKAARRAIPSLA